MEERKMLNPLSPEYDSLVTLEPQQPPPSEASPTFAERCDVILLPRYGNELSLSLFGLLCASTSRPPHKDLRSCTTVECGDFTLMAMNFCPPPPQEGEGRRATQDS